MTTLMAQDTTAAGKNRSMAGLVYLHYRNLRDGGKRLDTGNGLQTSGKIIANPPGMETAPCSKSGFADPDFCAELQAYKQLFNIHGRSRRLAPVDNDTSIVISPTEVAP